MHISSSVARIRFIKNVRFFQPTKEVEKRGSGNRYDYEQNKRTRTVRFSVCFCFLVAKSVNDAHTRTSKSKCVCVCVRNCTVGRNRKFSFFFSSFGESNKWVFSHIHTRKGICMRVCLIFYRKRKLIRKSTVVETLGSFGRGRKREREGECVIAVHTWRVAVQLAKCC